MKPIQAVAHNDVQTPFLYVALLLASNLGVSTLISSTHLERRNLISEKKQGKNRFYTLNRVKTLELVEFFEDIYDYSVRIREVKGYE